MFTIHMNNDIEQRFSALVESAKYDVSCSSSGSSRGNKTGMLGNTQRFGICHSFAADGRCISLLKILQTNICSYDCAYCVNRRSNDIPRAALTPDEIADITINFYKRNYIEGLFLSSAVYKSPDYSMELMTRTVELLRKKYRFNGYIHMKSIPGCDSRLVDYAGFLVDRLSVNIELPSEKSLISFAPDKTKKAILGGMSTIQNAMTYHNEGGGKSSARSRFLPGGQSTQLIVGASEESDRIILRLSESLYGSLRMRRVYYSGYVPVREDNHLPIRKPPLKREHRLYQADWLLRFYGFKAHEIVDDDAPYLDMEIDPKTQWAFRNMHLFPVDINRADYTMILRIPGIGLKSASKIVSSRKFRAVTLNDLKKMGVVLKRARYFIITSDNENRLLSLYPEQIRSHLIDKVPHLDDEKQLSLFKENTTTPEITFSALTGEL